MLDLLGDGLEEVDRDDHESLRGALENRAPAVAQETLVLRRRLNRRVQVWDVDDGLESDHPVRLPLRRVGLLVLAEGEREIENLGRCLRHPMLLPIGGEG